MYPEPQRSSARDRGWSSDADTREDLAADVSRLCEDARVRAVVDIPEYEVSRGEIGTVCSIWNLPWRQIEVEFICVISGEIKRALMNPDQIALHEESEQDASHDPENPDTCDETEDELQPA